jgi:hypothetical protein
VNHTGNALLLAMLPQILHSGRRLIERLETELLFCWFVGFSVDDAVVVRAALSRRRMDASECALFSAARVGN